MSTENYKAQASRLATHLASTYGWKLRQGAALEAIAQVHGHKSWNHLHAAGCPTGPKPPRAAAGLVAQLLEEALRQGARALHLSVSDEARQVMAQGAGLVSLRTLDTREQVEFVRELDDLARTVQISATLRQGSWLFNIAGEPHHCQAILEHVTPGELLATIVLHRIDPQNRPVGEVPDQAVHNVWRRQIESAAGLQLVVSLSDEARLATLDAVEQALQARGKQVERVTIDTWSQQSPRDVVGRLMRRAPDAVIFDCIRGSSELEAMQVVLESGHQVVAGVFAVNADFALRQFRAWDKHSEVLVSHLTALLWQSGEKAACPDCNGCGCPRCGNEPAGAAKLQVFQDKSAVRQAADHAAAQVVRIRRQK